MMYLVFIDQETQLSSTNPTQVN